MLAGNSVVLPCVNRRPLWREGLQEDQQQVAHWDFQPPGVRPDRADRLVDLYASGEKREYGALFPRNKMSVEEDAFSVGDFSLTISDLLPGDKGLYSCHLHHHYCGLHERRIFRLNVGPPLPTLLPPVITTPPHVLPNNEPSNKGMRLLATYSMHTVMLHLYSRMFLGLQCRCVFMNQCLSVSVL